MDYAEVQRRSVQSICHWNGCTMTNVFIVTHQELIEAPSCYSDVPAGCYLGSPGSGPIVSGRKCPNGEAIKNTTRMNQYRESHVSRLFWKVSTFRYLAWNGGLAGKIFQFR
ncbi:hypothetical protein BKA66DRAFT_597926 [Pyrenochaeta sp. MPI-SDFR-AT-0127]|nr:hypothetical protein BKA66DRAFT_597926 [Pyrenochaeta sp. MPI-SDFR-AT-0127]